MSKICLSSRDHIKQHHTTAPSHNGKLLVIPDSWFHHAKAEDGTWRRRHHHSSDFRSFLAFFKLLNTEGEKRVIPGVSPLSESDPNPEPWGATYGVCCRQTHMRTSCWSSGRWCQPSPSSKGLWRQAWLQVCLCFKCCCFRVFFGSFDQI